MKRVLTASVLIPLALYAIFWAPHWFFLAVAGSMAVLCYQEFTGIVAAHGIKGPLWLGHAGVLLLLWGFEPVRLLMLLLLAASLSVREMSRIIPFAGSILLGVVYIFGSWRCAVDLRQLSAYWILFALALNWVGDVAAFYVGRAIGRHKLAPRVSPGKSWEGALASTLAAVGFGVWFRSQVGLPVSVLEIVLLSILGNAAGQIGDLVESG
ncbi:MAG: phosphatidate cytidylyltransferase, partial [Bryobacteraceae bacterium]